MSGQVRTLMLCCMGLMLNINVAMAEHQMVLVAASSSPLHNVDSLELRKIYLGFTVMRDGHSVKGLLNTGDEDLNRIFYQNVVAMSEKSYMRRVVSLTLRKGNPRPAEYDKLDKLTDALSSDPYSVSYMWKVSAERSSNVKILRTLWENF